MIPRSTQKSLGLFILALFSVSLPILSEDQEKQASDQRKKEKPNGNKADEEFERLRAQFEKEKVLEVFQRIPTVEKFGAAPCQKTVEFLARLYDEEKNAAIFESASRALGRIGSFEAVRILVTKGVPTFVAEAEYELLLNDPNRRIDPEALARQKEMKLTVIGEALGNPLEPKAEEWLVKNALTREARKDPQVFEMLLKAVGKLKTKSKVTLLIGEIKRASSLALQASILESLRDTPDEKVASTAVNYSNSQDVKVRRAAYEILKSLQPNRYRSHFLSGLRSPDWQLRVLCVDALSEAKEKDLVKLLTPFLKDKDARVQVAVVQAFLKHGGAEVIEPLFRAIDGSPGRVQDDIADVLARLTGKNFGPLSAQWESWWIQNKDKGQSFTPLSGDEFLRLKEEEQLRSSIVVAYFGLRVLSGKVAFLIDCSESMEAEYVPRNPRGSKEERERQGKTVVVDSKEKEKEKAAGKTKESAKPKKGVSRLDVAKKEVTNVIGGLKDGDGIDIVRFNSVVTDFVSAPPSGARNLPKLDPSLRQQLNVFVAASKPEGLTNLFEAIKLAFDYEEIDTIYLLSDGAPTMGLTNHQELLQNVERLNRSRKVKINTISFNPAPEERKLLQALSDRNFGVYVER